MVFILFNSIFYSMDSADAHRGEQNARVYGTVISGPEGPSTRKFSFVINPGNVVKRGQFVQLDSEEGKLIGRVSDVYKTNRYFMRPEAVKEYESSGKRMDSIFPVSDWEYLVADVQSLGVHHKDGGFGSSLFPPSPGTKVNGPDPGLLSGFFGLDSGGLGIGKLQHHDVEARINPTRLLQKHLAILAISGAGKSFLSSVILEELLDRKPEQGQIATVIIDTHGEYASFADDPSYSARTRVFPVSDIRIGLSDMSPGQLNEFLPKLSFPQKRELFRVMRGMKKGFGMSDLMKAIEGDEGMKSVIRDSLLASLEELRGSGLFGVSTRPSLDDLARQGGLSVIDLSDTTDLFKKQVIVTHFARKLFDARRRDMVPPFLLVVEEAHQFAPERMREEHAISKGVITLITREGRKFNASLCLISQRPIQLSTTALSQCNTHVILRVTNPYDLDHIGKSSEGINQSVLNQISSLPVGSGLIVGEAVNFPLFVRVRKRKSRPSSKGLPMEEAAREYHRKSEQDRKDAREFMPG